MDEWANTCEPQGGSVFKKDDIGRRNGKAPNDKMAEMMKKTKEEAKEKISKVQFLCVCVCVSACVRACVRARARAPFFLTVEIIASA